MKHQASRPIVTGVNTSTAGTKGGTRVKGQWSPLTLVAIMATMAGAAMIGASTAGSASAWMGGVVLLLGMFATVASFFDQGAATGPTGHGDLSAAASSFSSVSPAPLSVGEMTASFNARFARHNHVEDLWPAFDRWMRDALNQFAGARRVRCFRVADGSRKLVALSGLPDDVFWSGRPPHGLIDHVIATGRRYLRGHAANGELIDQLAATWSNGRDSGGAEAVLPKAPDWIVPIQDNGATIGVLVAGELPERTIQNGPLVDAIGHLIDIYWRYMHQSSALAVAERTDRASGVLNRPDLTTLAEQVLADAGREQEPVVVLALSVEGVRRLDDSGEWELRDWLMKQIGVQMRRKLRSDDLVGRFSDDRFVAFLRRLDIGLGLLIARKLLEAAREGLKAQPIVDQTITLRCGLAANGHDGLDAVLVRAFDALQQARADKVEIVIAGQDSAKPLPSRDQGGSVCAREQGHSMPAAAREVSGDPGSSAVSASVEIHA